MGNISYLKSLSFQEETEFEIHVSLFEMYLSYDILNLNNHIR